MSGRLQGWRKLARASWSAPADPQFFGDLEVDAATLLHYLNTVRTATGVHVTPTHAVVRAIAHGLRTVPQLNIRIARNREFQRESVDVLVIVAAGDEELTGLKVANADAKSLVDVAREVEARTALIRAGDDPGFGKSKRMLSVLPRSVLRWGIGLSAWLTSDLNLDLSRYGLPRQAFGSAMVSSIGMTGIRHAYSPLAPYYRVPLLVLVGAITAKPVVVSGEVLARPVLTLTATFDHRYTDGLRAAAFARAAQAYLADPAAHEPPAEETHSWSAAAVTKV